MKEYAIILTTSKEDRYPYYMTRFYKVPTPKKYAWESQKYNYEKTGCIEHEEISYESIRRNTKLEDIHLFSLEEAERLLEKLRNKMKNYKNYASGRKPFLIKKTKINKFLKK